MGIGIGLLVLGLIFTLKGWALLDRQFGEIGVLHAPPIWIRKLFLGGRREVRVSEVLGLAWGLSMVIVGAAIAIGLVPSDPFANWLAGATVTLGAIVYASVMLALAARARLRRARR